ncbi:MAG: hypothetical protein V4671_04665 [Armatimonadota bacterium]
MQILNTVKPRKPVKALQAAVQSFVDKQAERKKERDLHLLFEKAGDVLAVISNTSMQLEIREGTTLSTWRFCTERFADDPRVAFTSLFGPDLMRWIDHHPASAGKLDAYLKGSH